MSRNAIIATIFGSVVVLSAIVVGVFVVQRQSTETRTQAAPASTIKLNASNENPSVGDSIQISALVTTNGNLLAGGELELLFDPAVLNVTSIDNGGYLGSSSSLVGEDIDNTGGKAYNGVFLSPGNPPPTGGVDASLMVFNASVVGQGSTTLDLGPSSTLVASGENAQNVLVSTTSVTVNVGTPIFSPTPSASAPSPTPTTDPNVTPSPTPTDDPNATPIPTATSSPATPTPTSDAGTGGPQATATPIPPTATSIPSSGSGSSSGSTSNGTLTVAFPANGTTITSLLPTFSGSGPASATIFIAFDNGLSDSVVTDASGDWTWTPTSNLTEGNHTATVTTNANTDTVVVNFTIDTNAQTLPQAGSVSMTITALVVGLLLMITGAFLLQ